MIYLGLIAWVFILAAVGFGLVVHYRIEQRRDRRWAAEHRAEPVTDEWLAILKATEPTFADLAIERDMGSIFEAGYDRQAKRLHAELEDDAALSEWLGGGSR